ncbi:DUF3817 domain-containing protein [Massilia sp.]|uniref:DUF3817 domain-containing protein n=1 Tax=Massilia sp. TaxID=1882437 RepID=UPI00289EF822|nr:DUF3817 domain-containing protein [Massilia sp.]
MMPRSRAASELAQLRQMRLASMLEGVTLVLLLGVAVPLKHFAHTPTAVTVLGPIHGLAFVFYFWTLLGTISGARWPRSEKLIMVAAALIPFGAFVCQHMLAKREAALLPPQC